MSDDGRCAHLPFLPGFPPADEQVEFPEQLVINWSNNIETKDFDGIAIYLKGLSGLTTDFYAFETSEYGYYSRDGIKWVRVETETQAKTYANAFLGEIGKTVYQATEWVNTEMGEYEIEKKLESGFRVNRIVFDQQARRLYMIFTKNDNYWLVRYTQWPYNKQFPALPETSSMSAPAFKMYFKKNWVIQEDKNEYSTSNRFMP